MGVDIAQSLCCGLTLTNAYSRRSMNNLSLQIGFIDGIAVKNANVSDSSGREIQEARRSQATGTNHQDGRVFETFLALDSDIRKYQVTRITRNFFFGEGRRQR
jgi:hypothetical protein